MTPRCPILKIQAAPGDAPRAFEQLDGDLLVPAAARPIIERALALVQEALAPEQCAERAALAQAMRLLGIEKIDTPRQALLANLVKVRPI